MNIKQLFKRPTLFKTISVLLPLLFIFAIILNRSVEIFRIHDNLHWIYQYGKLSSLIIGYGVLPISILNFLFIISEQAELKNRYLWIMIGFIPFIYFLIVFLYRI